LKRNLVEAGEALESRKRENREQSETMFLHIFFHS